MSRLITFILLVGQILSGQSMYAERKDPTRPAVYAATADIQNDSTKPVLSSILISTDRRLAVVDGHIFQEGERFNGLVMATIKPDQVTVLSNSKTFTLRLTNTGKTQ